MHLAVLGRHFQLSDFFGQLTPFLQQHSLQGIPVFPWPRTTRQCRDHINDGEIPFLLFGIPSGAHLFVIEDLDLVADVHRVDR